MASVWKRLQRVNKRAAKFQYTASYHRIDVEISPKWKPHKLSVVWTRRSRRAVTTPQQWEPSLKDPLKGTVVYAVPENQTVAVTLFKDARTNELEDKDWTFVLEDVSVMGKRRRLASCAINMRKFASLEPAQRTLALPLDPLTHKVGAATLHLTLHCVLLREGQATDEDMQSLASLLSVNNMSDVAVLADLDEDDCTLSDQSTRQMLDLRQQMEEMTNSLTNSDIAATPNSVQSLSFDNCRTPSYPFTPSNNVFNPSNDNFNSQTDSNLPYTPTTPTNQPNITDNPLQIIEEDSAPFTSTPNKDLKLEYRDVVETKSDLKSFSFKPKTVAKRNLKPLELTSNLNNISNLDKNDNEADNDKTPTADSVEKLAPPRLDRDKTPVADLLEWCQGVTSEYKQCRVTDLTLSFRSGLALCAIIHRFRPHLIDFSGLQPEEAEKNIRVALEASSRLDIAQVLTVQDVMAGDKLAIMTYLFQLRAHFTGNELQVEQLGASEDESSYLVGRHDTDAALPPELFSREVATRRSRTMGVRPPVRNSAERSPEKVTPADMKDALLQHSRSILQKVLPSKEKEKEKPTAKWFTDPLNITEGGGATQRPAQLMTRKELTDPFASDDEDEPRAQEGKPETKTPVSPLQIKEPLSPITLQENIEMHNSFEKQKSPELPKPPPQLLSRHDELRERARQLLEATKKEAKEKERNKRQSSKEKEDVVKIEPINGLTNGESVKKPMTEEERQAMLRERARKLIADARAGLVSPTSPTRTSPGRVRPGTVEIISKHSLMEEIAAAGGAEQLDALLAQNEASPVSGARSRNSSASPDRSEPPGSEESRGSSPDERRSPLHSLSALVERLTPDKENVQGERGSYIASEVDALEREQAAIDARAAGLEKQLRSVMQTGAGTESAWRKLFASCVQPPSNPEEDRLMSQWFNLVNKKNALLRRQMQLNILEQEEDLSRRCELLARELRLSLAVDEWRKGPGQKRRERLLLQELLEAVNERDRLVQEMDEQEKAIADDDAIVRNLSQVELQQKNNCILQ